MFIEDDVCAGDFCKDVGSFGGPDERLWILVVPVDVVSDGHDEVFEVREYSASDMVLSQARKNRSILLSHEDEVGVSGRETACATSASVSLLHAFG